MRTPPKSDFHSTNTHINRKPLPFRHDERLETMGSQLSQKMDIVGSKPTFLIAVRCLSAHRSAIDFKKFRDWLFPEYEDFSLLCRALIARTMVLLNLYWEGFEGKALLLSLSSNGTISQEMVAMSASEGISLFHTVSIAFATQSCSLYMTDCQESDLEPALRDLVRMSDDIHHRESIFCTDNVRAFSRVGGEKEWINGDSGWCWTPGTLLITIMRVAATRGSSVIPNPFASRRRLWHRKLDQVIRRWLNVLLECGIDLKVYGEREHSVIFGKSPGDDSLTTSVPLVQPVPFIYWGLPLGMRAPRFSAELNDLHHRHDFVPFQLWLRDFSYGPKVEDWSMDWEIETSINVKRLYDIVGRPNGSWQVPAECSEWYDVEAEENDRENEDAAKEAVIYGPPRMPGSWVEENSDDSEVCIEKVEF